MITRKSLSNMSVIGSAMALSLTLYGLDVSAECSVKDRIDLSKAGYSKDEIETLCQKGAEPAATPPTGSSPLTVLKSARYDSSEDPALGGAWHPRNRCEFLDDHVKLNNIKKTLGGHKSAVVPYRDFWAASQQIRIDKDKGVTSSHIVLMAMGFPNANETCYALLDRRIGLAADRFDKAESEVRQAFRKVLDALQAMGVDIKDPL
jgi:hypothetical protein